MGSRAIATKRPTRKTKTVKNCRRYGRASLSVTLFEMMNSPNRMNPGVPTTVDDGN